MLWINFLALFISSFLLNFSGSGEGENSGIHIRINQIGYLPGEHKSALLLSHYPVKEEFELIADNSQSVGFAIKPQKSKTEGRGNFQYCYKLDFTDLDQPGIYHLRGKRTGAHSSVIRISREIYDGQPEKLLGFMRQQRCGYNPYLKIECHQKDGRSFYGPMPDSSYVDVSGGWHDAGDQLKYLITASYATAHMLEAYMLYPDMFKDYTSALGQPGANGTPDVLDEARWGLEWIQKLHPAPDQLVHQVADDRDHVGWKMPDQDPSDYGWGRNGYRPAYFANGKPQGLNRFMSIATGVSNLAGRSAAAMAMAYRIWSGQDETAFAEKCLTAAQSLYALGKEKEGFQQGNSFGAPYRYGEETWSDDMEWGAAELFKATGDSGYLADAIHYARMAGIVSWMPYDTAEHYQYYPFINLGHHALHEVVDNALRDTLEGYYRSGIESCLDRAGKNLYGIGIPLIWCSNNLLTALITQIILYEKMTGDLTYHSFLVEQRDWLFGRNPWGTSMFTGIPEGGEFPVEVHTSIWALTKQEVAGGLVDGPVNGPIYNSLRGLVLTHPDEFSEFQSDFAVYHDDAGDYSTNEPTMDGTAGSLLMMAYWANQ